MLSESGLFPEENPQKQKTPFWEVLVVPRISDNFYWTSKTHILQTKIDETCRSNHISSQHRHGHQHQHAQGHCAGGLAGGGECEFVDGGNALYGTDRDDIRI